MDDEVRRIAVFRALPGLGDLLVAVPALRALRAAHPRARITLVGLPPAAAFVRRFGAYVDELLPFPGFPGLPDAEPRIAEVPGFYARAQARRFHLALQMHGSGRYSNPAALLLGARRAAGLYTPGEWKPSGGAFAPFRGDEPERRRCLRVLHAAGIPGEDESLEFPLTEADRAELAAAAPGLDGGEGFACIHPGASTAGKRWPAERFAAVADALAERGLRVVLTGGADERYATAAVARAMRAPALDLAGRTGLGALGALLADARIVVCNDTGVSHLADALRVPSVVVFMAADPARWAPADRALHRPLGLPAGFAPPPWMRDPAGAWVPDVAEVLGEADVLLAGEAAGVA